MDPTPVSMLGQRRRRWANIDPTLWGLCWINERDTDPSRDIDPMLYQCWASVVDGGPTLIQHCENYTGSMKETRILDK